MEKQEFPGTHFSNWWLLITIPFCIFAFWLMSPKPTEEELKARKIASEFCTEMCYCDFQGWCHFPPPPEITISAEFNTWEDCYFACQDVWERYLKFR